MKKFLVNNIYRTKSGKLVVFLGYQDGTLRDTRGFFREFHNPNTFFGLNLEEIQKPIGTEII